MFFKIEVVSIVFEHQKTQRRQSAKTKQENIKWLECRRPTLNENSGEIHIFHFPTAVFFFSLYSSANLLYSRKELNVFTAKHIWWISKRMNKSKNNKTRERYVYRLDDHQQDCIPSGETRASLSIDGVWSGIQQLIQVLQPS